MATPKINSSVGVQPSAADLALLVSVRIGSCMGTVKVWFAHSQDVRV
jgi:hypothetical protein